MDKTLCAAYGASENLPTVEEIENAGEGQARAIAKDLLDVAQEARMSALHFKLQNSLLSFASSEAVKRAEVEHQLARREVEILQSPEYRSRRTCEVKPAQPFSPTELEDALQRSQGLQTANANLDRRLRRAKKLIEQEREKSDLLAEENSLLKKRIRDNREHFSRMIDHGSMSPSPRTEFQTPNRRHVPHFAHSPHLGRSESHDPFAALLAADKVLNRESAGMTPSPYRQRALRHPSDGHDNLVSHPLTPARSRSARRGREYLTPMRNHDDDRRDRDSTISASDAEEAETDIEMPASQTSSHAPGPLRHNAVRSQQETRESGKAPKSSTLLQTKLFGHVRKPGVEPASQLKRKGSFEDGGLSKKPKAAERVGLGIEAWNTAH